MPTARFQPSFAAGVLGPGLHGRIDIAKYDVGLKIGRNVIVHTYGGVSNRPGTEFIAELWDHSVTYRLIPFKRDEDDNYAMVMGDGDMRILFNGAWVESSGSPYTPTTPYSSTDLDGLDYVQSVDVMYFAHPGHFPQQMARASLASWSFADLAIDPVIALPTNVTVAPDGSGSKTYKYKVSPVVGGVEGFPSAEVSTTAAQDLVEQDAFNTISWSGSADEYNIYRERNGVYGYIGFTDATSFKDDNIALDLTTTPVGPAGLFDGAGTYPSAVSLFQQRLMFASSESDPETIWGSRTGDYMNFTRSRILRADDRIETNLSGSQVQRVVGMLPLRELLVFTQPGEFSLTGPQGAFPATNPIQTQYGYAGSYGVKPIVVDDTALFVDRTGRQVRDLRYAFEQDGYNSNELTIFAAHYFHGKKIAGFAYQQSPFSIIWTHLDDGTLLSLTYKREHQIWAWTEHDIGGAVESMVAIPEGADDVVYMVVRRIVNGATVRYIERIRNRAFDVVDDAFFVDCGISYSGAATKTISGLDHLEGEGVVALADGSVVENLQVSGGSVTLPVAATKVQVGLRMEAEIETLPPAIDLQDVGAARGRPHATPTLRIQMEKTRGIEVAASDRAFWPLTETPPDLADPFPMITGIRQVTVGSSWSTEGTVVIRQRYPLPMTILGISTEISVGRSG